MLWRLFVYPPLGPFVNYTLASVTLPFPMEFSIFNDEKIICILHGHGQVFVMYKHCVRLFLNFLWSVTKLPLSCGFTFNLIKVS